VTEGQNAAFCPEHSIHGESCARQIRFTAHAYACLDGKPNPGMHACFCMPGWQAKSRHASCIIALCEAPTHEVSPVVGNNSGSLGDGKQVATYGKLWQMRLLQGQANLQQTHPGAIFGP